MLDIQTRECAGRKAAYRIFGSGKIDIVIEMGLGAVLGEWWHVGQLLAARHTVLLYERAGYGRSEGAASPRTPVNIARELKSLLDDLPHADQVIIIGHSQGGLYAQQFARLYPNVVRGLVLLDPLTAEDDQFRSLLTAEEFRKSGVDKFSNLRLSRSLARLHLGCVIKAVMKSAPPFYYYAGFSDDARRYILNALTQPAYYDTAMAEYELAHAEEAITGLADADGFPNIPLVLITHSSVLAENETMKFGHASPELAAKVETIWQTLMKRYLSFSAQSSYIEAKNSTHYIHLTQPELMEQAILRCNDIRSICDRECSPLP